MCLKQKKPLSCSLMTRTVSFQKCVKTNHKHHYSGKLFFFLVHKSCGADFFCGSTYERNIFY